ISLFCPLCIGQSFPLLYHTNYLLKGRRAIVWFIGKRYNGDRFLYGLPEQEAVWKQNICVNRNQNQQGPEGSASWSTE
ncbi:hypothetical protein OSK28_26240, partial [Escherichia coli]|nr:hypothetical protein [Escherichia coli]